MASPLDDLDCVCWNFALDEQFLGLDSPPRQHELRRHTRDACRHIHNRTAYFGQIYGYHTVLSKPGHSDVQRLRCRYPLRCSLARNMRCDTVASLRGTSPKPG